MMKKSIPIILISLSTYSNLVLCLPVNNRPATSADFIAMDNQIEGNIYFTTLTPGTRLTGTTQFTSAPQHSGLVYISDGGDKSYPPTGNYRIAVWSESSPVNQPYDGLHCWKYLSNCVDSIRYPDLTVKNSSGFTINSLVRMKGDVDHALNPKLSLSLSNYLLQLPIGASYTDTMNRCYTNSVSSSIPCKDVTGGTSLWERTQVTLTKKAHLKFLPTKSKSILMLSSNGDVIALPGSKDCLAQTDGIICKHVNLEFSNSGLSGIQNLNISVSLTNQNIANQISSSDLKVSFNKNSWFGLDQKLPFSTLLNGDKEGIYVYLSKRMLTVLLSNGFQGKLSSLIKFSIRNEISPGSGFYEFFGSSEIEFISRKPHLAILSKDGELHPYRVAMAGKENIYFDYIITESGFSQAESIRVSIQQDLGSPHNGLCTFYANNDLVQHNAIAIPTKLTLQGKNGLIESPIKCNTEVVDLRKLGIKESQAPIPWTDLDGKEGLTKSYDLRLEFDLKSPSSKKTISGEEWEGEAHQSGKIKVEAIWL